MNPMIFLFFYQEWGNQLQDYYALPSVLVILEWIILSYYV